MGTQWPRPASGEDTAPKVFGCLFETCVTTNVRGPAANARVVSCN